MQAKRRIWSHRGWWLMAIGLVAGTGWLIAPSWTSVNMDVDLSHTTAQTAIVSGAEIVPSLKWRGVMDVYDAGKPLVLAISLPARDAYFWRIKLAFREVGQQIRVFLNGTSVAQWTAAKGNDAAEKFQLRTQPGTVHEGRNLVEFRHDGPPRSVRYEQVRARNYRTEIVPGAAYLADRAAAARRLAAWGWLGWCLIVGAAFGAVVIVGSRLVNWAYGGSAAQAAAWRWLPIPVLTAVVVAGILVERVSPYRLLLSPLAGLILLVGLAGVHDLVVMLPGLVWRGCRWAIRRLAGLQLPVRMSLRSIQQLIPWLLRLAWAAACLLGRWLFRVGTVWIPTAARAVWRWWCRHQTAEGYARFFLYLLVISGILWWLKIKPLADRVGEWAWCALLISCLGYAFRALRTDREVSRS